jgi:hypothetical protein
MGENGQQRDVMSRMLSTAAGLAAAAALFVWPPVSAVRRGLRQPARARGIQAQRQRADDPFDYKKAETYIASHAIAAE